MMQKKKYDPFEKEEMGGVEKSIWILFAVFVSSMFITITRIKTGIYYETNDDIFISDILSGAITGTADYHTIFNGVALSFPLMILYRLLPEFAWYGFFLMFLRMLTIALPLVSLYMHLKNRVLIVLTTVLASMCFFSFYYMQSNVQFTSTAICAAFSGFLCLFIDERKNMIPFFLLEFLAYNTRIQSMEIIQPIGFALLGSVIICDLIQKKAQGKKYKLSNVFIRLVIPLCISLMIIMLGNLLFYFSYRTDEWKDFLSVNNARASMMDYTRVPLASEVENILDEKNVSKEEYTAYTTYMNYAWDNSNGVIEKVADYVASNTESNVKIWNTVKWVFCDSYLELKWGIGKLLVCAWGICIIWVFLTGKLRYVLCVVAYFGAKLISWGYVYMLGRMPLRIIMPLCQVELIVPLFIAFLCVIQTLNENKKSKRYILAIGGVFLTLVLGIYAANTLRKQYRYICNLFVGTEYMSQVRGEVCDYCNSNSDKTFLISLLAYSYWTSEVLDCPDSDNNWRYSGGWFGSMPGNKEYVESYLEDDEFFFIAPYGDELLENIIDSQLTYLKYKYEANVSMQDFIYLSNGGVYAVYQVSMR